ncbi:MAG TPA: hypothetical protein PKD99_02445 [Sphingopyxis sp.]|nr:hypothetical protein [Sphingopyxis sp.]HMP43937.1 hypothetical protein [Sphingopyxis sp.]HMQ20026.1 hypothetical protein [Sphingopyxis sp.]
MAARSQPRRKGRLQRIFAIFARRQGNSAAPEDRRIGDGEGDRETWAPGDLAEHVGAGVWFDILGFPQPGPRVGEVLCVAEVRIALDPRTGRYAQFLYFARFGPRGYLSTPFRKLTPRADAVEPADAAFLDDLKALPVPVAAGLERS